MTPPSSSAKTASAPDSFFTATLAEADPEIAAAIRGELGRQRHEIELIASENIVSRAVLEAQGSVMTNKYAEGYPGKRYYGGCEFVDVAETLAIERAKKLFGCEFANEHKPKLILAGGTAYSRYWDFKKFREIADSVGAYLMVDMAHIAGLVAGGVHPSPFPHAHVVTTTTHKSLRGPRGGVILTNDEEIAKKMNSAVFPGLQGGPLMHVIAAKAVALGEALRPDFKIYAKNVVENARALAETLRAAGFDIVSGG